MKKKLAIIFSMIFMFSALLFACSGINLSSGPDANATVYGNGGSAVIKGDYIYFANAYIASSELGNNDNQYDKKSKQTIYGIYRSKLDSEGNVVLNDDGVPQGAEILTYNVGGFEQAQIYLCGEWIYYTTPYTVKGSDGSSITGLVRFDRIKLDGTSHEQLSSSGEDGYTIKCKFNVVYVGGATYIVVSNEAGDVDVIKCQGGGYSKYSLATGTLSYVVASQNVLKANGTRPEVENYLYFVRKTSVGSAYEIVRKPLSGGAETSILVDTNQPELVAMKNGRVYYTLNSNLYSTTDGATSKSYLSAPLKDENQTSEITSTYVILDDADGLDRGVVAVYYDGTNYRMLYQNGGKYQAITTVAEGTKEITILASQRDEIYYQIADSSELYMLRLTLSYENSKFVLNEADEPKVIASSFTTKNGDYAIYDYDLEHFYTYEQVENSQLQYLKMYSIHSPKKDADDKVVGQYIGLLSEQDSTLVNAD